MRGEVGETDRIGNIAISIKEGLAQRAEAEAAAFVPPHALTDTATVFTGNDFFIARHNMGDSMIPHFNADMPPPHFMRDGPRCA